MDVKDKLKDLADTVAQYAPLLGSALGGPGGAAIGSIVASVFGSKEDLGSVAKLVKSDPEAAIKLRGIEVAHRERLEELAILRSKHDIEADTKRIGEVNATMRVEAGSGDLWQRRWRPFWGFLTAIAFFLQILVMVYTIIFKAAQAPGIIVALASLDIFWAVPLTILGVSAYHRGKEKRVLAGEDIKPLVSFRK